MSKISSDVDLIAVTRLLSSLTYPQSDFDAAVLHFPHTASHTNPSKTKHKSARPQAGLGAFRSMPPELLTSILLLLDLGTIADFSILNRSAYTFVHSMPAYSRLYAYASGALQALFLTGAAAQITLDELYTALCTSVCGTCGAFAGYLFLPAGTRCCIPCLRSAPALQPMTKTDAKAAYGLQDAELDAGCCPRVTTLPGVYTPEEVESKRRLILLSPERVRAAAVAVHGGEQGLEEFLEKEKGTQKMKELKERMKKRNTKIDYVKRFMVATPFPYFDRTSQSVLVGMSCQGCDIRDEEEEAQTRNAWWQSGKWELPAWQKRRDALYTEEGFLRHFQECRGAQQLYKSLQE